MMKKTNIQSMRGLVCVLAAGMAISVLGTTAALAATVWLDEFDEWCDPDPGPGNDDLKCPVSTSPNAAAFGLYYPLDLACDSAMLLQQGTMWDPGGYGIIAGQKQLLVRHVHDMTSEIVALSGSETAVNGKGDIEESPATGACCLVTSCVEDQTPDSCETGLSGTFMGAGTECVGGDSFCDAAGTGACCAADGTCSETTRSSCTGDYRGAGTTCATAVCTGACCMPDGSCLADKTQNECDTAGGAYTNGGTSCADAACDYVDPETIATVLKGEHKSYVNGGSAANTVQYVEWSAEDDHAPVNWNMMNCFTDWECDACQDEGLASEKGIWRSPILIRTDGKMHASFALGMFALYDDCMCDLSYGHAGSVNQPVAYDGLNWVRLTGLPSFPSAGWSQFKYYIGSTHIEIRMKAGTGDWVKTRIARQYPGPFNHVAMGTPPGVDQDPARCERSTWNGNPTCVGGINRGDACDPDGDPIPVADQCPPSIGTCAAGFCLGGTNHGNECSTPGECPDYEECLWVPRGYEDGKVNATKIDELLLADGIFDWPGSIPGACCERDGGCVENKTETECKALDGEYKGGDTTCAGVTCTGACCLNPDGSCQDSKTEEQCVDTLGGSYNGGGSTCAEVDCGGACCLPDATCQQAMTEADCDALSGRFQGLGIACDDVTCCPDPFADADTDGDVDQKDFGLFQACYSGSGNAHEDGCGCLNRNPGEDDDIDELDFAAFSACYSGPTVPANRTCDD